MSNDNTLTPNSVLMSQIDKLDNLLLVGVTKDGQIHIDTSRPTFENIHYLLGRAAFKINAIEDHQFIQALKAKEAEQPKAE